jgi:cell wall-associated NlpC family hydrolase
VALGEKQLAEFVANELLGKPFKLGADGPSAYDCYGVVRVVLWKGFDIWMPTIQRMDINHYGLARRLLEPEVVEDWIEVPNGKNGDVMVMGNVDGRDYHLGLRLRFGNNHMVLHTEEKIGVVLDDIQTLSVRGYHKIRYRRHRTRFA